jgi:hypothetical protein
VDPVITLGAIAHGTLTVAEAGDGAEEVPLPIPLH